MNEVAFAMNVHCASLSNNYFLCAARNDAGAALSHCWYGRNRSVSLLVAYLMKDEGMTISEATKLIKKTRPQADPYTNVLKEYARRYLGDE